MAYKVFHSAIKCTVLKTWEEVEVYYQVQHVTCGHYPSHWVEVSEEEYIEQR